MVLGDSVYERSPRRLSVCLPSLSPSLLTSLSPYPLLTSLSLILSLAPSVSLSLSLPLSLGSLSLDLKTLCLT